MIDRPLKNNILKAAIGVPVILLLLSLVLLKDQSVSSIDSSINPFLNTLPPQYARVLNKSKESDSTLFYSIIQDFGIRELVILKSSPTDIEKRQDFIIELRPKDKKLLKKNAKHFNFNITNDAAMYNYKGEVYGLFRKSLPAVDFEELIIRQKKWNTSIKNSFKQIGTNFQFEQIDDKGTLSHPNPYLTILKDALSLKNIAFLKHSYTVNGDTLLQKIKDLPKHVSESKQTIGFVEKENQFWSLLNRKHAALKANIKFQGNNSKEAENLIESYLSGDKLFETVFNTKKLADFFALKNVFSSNCVGAMYFLYNFEDDLLEPFFVESNCLGLMNKNVEASKINDINFISTFIESLNEVSQINIHEEIIKKNSSFEKELGFINTYYPEAVFDLDIIQINQRIIKKSLDPSTTIVPELRSYKDRKMELVITNNSIFPINIMGLHYKTEKEIAEFDPFQQIPINGKDTIIIDLPRSFENLFVSKKKKNAGFNLYKDIYDLNIVYSIPNLGQKHYSAIYPFQQVEEKTIEDLLRIKSTIEDRDDIIINEKDKTITFSKPTITIASPLIIPAGYKFNVKAGTIIDVINGGKIISYASLQFKGSKQAPIKIISSDKKGQGLIVFSEGKESKLEHVIFDGLSNPKHGYWTVTGAVTFYESPVNLTNVSISNNSCEDALNIVRTTFSMINCAISDTQSDAFDGDFVSGAISGTRFDNLGNDAIDVSGSELKINDVQISKAGDKGLSAGEESKMWISNVKIIDSEIAIAGKDLSIIEAKNLKISNTKLAFTAFQKKPEYGPSQITVNVVEMGGIETKYLIESSSTMKIDGVIVETSKNVKGRMYGVEFGVSSEETRNSNR